MSDVIASLSPLFAPRSIAVVGASSNAQKIGGIPVDYLQRFGFEGDVYPVNPTVGPVGQALFRAWVCVTGDYPALAMRFTTTQTREAVACALPLLSRAA